MKREMSRRGFLKNSVVASAGGALAISAVQSSSAQVQENKPAVPQVVPGSKDNLPKGKIGNIEISRMILGGNLLTCYTHARDLNFVCSLIRNYNTQRKVMETMALAESHGIDTLSIHTAPGAIDTIKKYKREWGGKIKSIVCPTADITPDMKAYSDQVKQLVDDGIEAIYLWGVRSDPLVAQGKIDLVAKAVQCAKDMGVPSGVGAHDLNVIKECEKHKVNADFYIKTFHHHRYATGPKPEQIKGATAEVPGYWCSNPEETIAVMKNVEKPWMAFKIMAAGTIPPRDAFRYAFENGADHALVGMFDFEIAEDVRIMKEALASVKRERPWRS